MKTFCEDKIYKIWTLTNFLNIITHFFDFFNQNSIKYNNKKGVVIWNMMKLKKY